MISLELVHESDLYGGKAASLGKLIRGRFNVQPGLALDWSYTPRTSMELLHGLADIIGSLKVTVHSKWAVRSSAIGEDSAAHSFAGQHDTLLNVECWELEQAVSVVRKSANSKRAKIYRRDRRINGGAKMGVVIQ